MGRMGLMKFVAILPTITTFRPSDVVLCNLWSFFGNVLDLTYTSGAASLATAEFLIHRKGSRANGRSVEPADSR